ncbi:serine hydrolase [Pseudoalteromonas sp. MMG022]|uniref:serine hydrolase domain-containing protein n=1 Tax=Pseudoalteromonas sp. MMG022 TaxID=2909978 RepID=UPI001F31A7B5|nr:serine hydrolase [Pseudoalteromonas sp. MMG022]MCF6437618.1 serine hydrolase [Pseudoalteromonas sp. MMG022]
MNMFVKHLLAMSVLSTMSTTLYANTIDTKPCAKTTTPAPVILDTQKTLSFWDFPNLEKAYLESTPSKRKDGIKVGQLGIDGGDKAHIITLAKEIANQKHSDIDSLLIAHKDKLIFESYYLRGRVDLPHPQASATKSYVSMALGRAIELGYLSMADLNKPIIHFLQQLDTSKMVKGADKITLHKALNMRSGIRLTRAQQDELAKQSEQMKGQAQVQTYLQHSPTISAQSQSFNYQNLDPKLVMQVLDAVVPGGAKAFIKKELLDKLGIKAYHWADDVSGLPMAPYHSQMTSRNMLKWGQLVKNKGKWQGEQLISKEFMSKATQNHTTLGQDDIFFTGKHIINPGYGYYFWQADMQVGNKRYATTSAQGGGGQYIILVDELDLIIVFTASTREERIMELTAQRILPAFI